MRLARGKILIAILLAVALSACAGGGGGGGADTSLPIRTLVWGPPTQYADNAVIGNPILELKEYWIYVKTDNAAFTPADGYVKVNAVDPATNQLVTSYDLRLAASALSLKQGIRYYVAMRAVSTADVASDFSDPALDFMF